MFGSLFRYDNRSRQKTNLMIFLKPTIVRNTSAGQALTSERYDYLRGEQLRTAPGERWFWDDPTLPELPPPGTLPGTPQTAPSGTVPRATQAPVVVTPAPSHPVVTPAPAAPAPAPK